MQQLPEYLFDSCWTDSLDFPFFEIFALYFLRNQRSERKKFPGKVAFSKVEQSLSNGVSWIAPSRLHGELLHVKVDEYEVNWREISG